MNCLWVLLGGNPGGCFFDSNATEWRDRLEKMLEARRIRERTVAREMVEKREEFMFMLKLQRLFLR